MADDPELFESLKVNLNSLKQYRVEIQGQKSSCSNPDDSIAISTSKTMISYNLVMMLVWWEI
jgi:hypothetical protein